MRVKRRPEPLLRGLRIRRIDDAGDVGERLIILNDPFGAAKIVADHPADQLDERLPVPQDPRFEHFRQKRVAKPDRQNRRHPARQKNRDHDVEALEAIVAAFFEQVSKWHTARKGTLT